MTIKNSVFLFLIISVLFSCQGPSTKSSVDNGSTMTVDWNETPVKPIPKIREDIQSDIGPQPIGDVSQAQLSGKKKAIKALVIGSGLYRTIAVIPLLKTLVEQNEEPVVIVGHGLSAIVAAYYAMGFKADFIEWKFFKFLNELEDKEIFKEKWLSLVEKKLLNDLKKFRVEDGKITLIVPVWDETKKKVLFVKRGNLRTLLLANIDPHNILKQKLKPSFTHAFVPRDELRDLGVNKIVAVDFLTSGLSWKKGNGFLNGTYQKAASVQLKEIKKMKDLLLVQYPLENFPLDGKSGLTDLVHLSRKLSPEKMKILKEEESL